MKGKRYHVLLLVPPGVHLALMVLFSLIPPAEHTYGSLALISLSLGIPLTILFLAAIMTHQPAVCPLFPLSFASIPLILYPVMRLILKYRSYDLLPYEWSKYPRLILQYYAIPFFLASCAISFSHIIHHKRKKDTP